MSAHIYYNLLQQVLSDCSCKFIIEILKWLCKGFTGKGVYDAFEEKQ